MSVSGDSGISMTPAPEATASVEAEAVVAPGEKAESITEISTKPEPTTEQVSDDLAQLSNNEKGHGTVLLVEQNGLSKVDETKIATEAQTERKDSKEEVATNVKEEKNESGDEEKHTEKENNDIKAEQNDFEKVGEETGTGSKETSDGIKDTRIEGEETKSKKKKTKDDSKKASLDADNDSDGDSVDEVMEALRFKYEDMEKRVKLAPKRLKQQNQYTKILEERISLLEERYEALDKKLKKPGVLPLPAPEPKPDQEAALGFKFWQDFKNSALGLDHIIDVLVGEAEFSRPDKIRRKRAVGPSAGGVNDNDPLSRSEYMPAETIAFEESRILEDEVTAFKGKDLPDRIRFNLVAITRLFSKFLGNSDAVEPDNILLRPFKPLLQNYHDIKDLMIEVAEAVDVIISQRKDFDVEKKEAATSPNSTQDPPSDEESDSPAVPKPPKSLDQDEWEQVLRRFNLYHCSECTKTFVKDWPTKLALERSFDCMRDLLDNYLLPVHTKFSTRQVKSIEFRDLWHLFQTGDLVMAKLSGNETTISSPLGMRVLMTSGGRRVISPSKSVPLFEFGAKDDRPSLAEESAVRMNGFNPFCIQAYFLDYDGSRLVPVRRRFIIPPYTGERKVADLEVFPMEYASNMVQQLEDRGRRFVDLATAKISPYVNCVGPDLDTREELNDKVIVDMKGYFSAKEINAPAFTEPPPLDLSETIDCVLGSDCVYIRTSTCPHRSMKIIADQATDILNYNEYIDGKPEFNTYLDPQEAKTRDEDLPICHYRVFAYKLRSREWVQVNVEGLNASVDTDPSRSFNLLVLSPNHKEILESQVREHFRKRGLQSKGAHPDTDIDLVKGKGQGLIILLHGAPGVGKTCTAECIAELVQKPLYPLTCGDLGSTAEEVEKNLKKHFNLASKWDCVMLLDEADVFLARRRSEDLHRNSIVSVFLRMLEYYKGLLFLTTNRVGAFDEAFKSRVHITLFYPDFDEDSAMAVWKTFIKQATDKLSNEGRKKFFVDSKGIEKFARRHWKENPQARWNGRQIRNAFHTAVAMAEFDSRRSENSDYYDDSIDVKISVGRDQFKKIAKTAREFDEYMIETMGDTYDGKAWRNKMRRKEEKGKEESSKREKKTSKEPKKKEESSDSSESSAEDKREKKKPKKKKGKKEVHKSEESTSESE